MSVKESDTAFKIQHAIQQKLLQMDALLDDSLPEYIMILIANQRSKSQMEKDLSLFLGSETTTFIDWLWNLLANYKEGNRQPSEPVAKSKVEDTDVIDYNPEEQDGDLLSQEDEKVSKKNELPKKLSTENKLQTKSIQSIASTKPKDHNKIVQKSAKVYPVQKISKTVPVKPKVLSTVNPVKHSTNSSFDEYDPARPEINTSMSSVVCVTTRKKGVTAALQANKILQKAVQDANKSILAGKSLTDYYQPTPINLIGSKITDHVPSTFLAPPIVNEVIPCNVDSELLQTVEHEPYIMYDNNNHPSVNIYTQENYILTDESKNNRTICLPSKSDNKSTVDGADSFVTDTNEQKGLTSPHFFVTLDGIDFPTLKRKHSFCDEEPMDIEEVYEEEPPEKKRKSEKCKFWPACKNSSGCLFHHPTVTCKKFPDCTFGDKCLYIHPNCKFDALCSRKDCPYTHASKRNLNAVPVHPKIPVKQPSKIVCKYFPHCTAQPCPFIHPKLCRYGTKCRAPACTFSHFNVPSRKELRWTARV